jgi:DNA-directed RNA polymerase I, II, and III subunit RPABC3
LAWPAGAAAASRLLTPPPPPPTPACAVDRIVCKGETYETDVFVDVASEEYRLRVGDKFTMTLTSTLNLDGTPDADEYVPDGKPNLLDDYEYGMCGKVFKYEYLSDKRVAAVASFGGLLLLVQGEQRHLVRIQLDQKVYCLMRKSS